MSYPYNTKSVHPFPILPVTVYQLEGATATSTLPALLDTGADITLVPLEQLQTIQSDEIYTAYLRMHWGTPRPVAVHLVDLDIDGHRLPAIEVIADDHDDRVLLGRNVLNKLILLLDGVQKQTDILYRRPLRF